MRLADLHCKNRGELLEIAEILNILPDADLRKEDMAAAIIFVCLPNWKPDIQWHDIVRKHLAAIKQIDTDNPYTFVSVATGDIVIIPGVPPIDFEGEPIEKAVTPLEAHTINIYVLTQLQTNE